MSRTGRAVTATLTVLVTLLLLPAVVLTVVRLLDPGFGLGLQLQAFTPFAILLYAAAVLVLVVAAVARRRLRLAVLGGAMVPVVGLVLHGWWFAPMLTGDRPPAAADAEPVTVLVANVLVGGADAGELVDRVRDDGVDLLVVSEVTEGFLDELDRAGLAAQLPHRVGEPAPDGRVEGTVAFAREPVRLVAEVDTVLDSFVLETGGLTVLATHPSPPTLPDEWHRDHDVLAAAVAEHRPDLVVGDLNATLDHAPVRALVERGYRDAVEVVNGGFEPTWSMQSGPGLVGAVGLLGPVAQIDHVLVGQRLTVLTASTHDLTDSDHRMVVATVAARE